MNSWHIQQLKFAFGIGGFMSFYGIVGLIVLMLPAGTASYNQKIVVIALVVLTMPLALITGYVINRRSKKKAEKAAAEAEAKGDEKADDKAPKVVAPTGDFTDINNSTEEVVQFLKTSNLGEVGKDAVYSLPWYLVAGTPKAGKSSLVMGSNLNFQNLPSQRQSEQKFVRSTQSIDWRVTSDAVFVDTAGRYQAEGADADEWAGLIETIKKYRKKRPIDGFLLVANAERILQSSEEEVEQMAKVLRTRLDDVMTRTKVRFPVYLIFTNADSIEGFRDSFSTSKGEAKNLVWGATIPIEKSDNAQTLFDGEYEILHDSLMKRRLMRLSAPFPPVRQLRIFNFPLHFGSARRKIGSFVSTLFRPNPFSESPFLRGFYFTAAPVARPQMPQGGKTMAPNQAQTVGSTYFTERLFRDVILRDKDLVRTMQEQKQRPPILGWVLTTLGALLILSLLTLAGVSLYNNNKMLDEATVRGEEVLNIVKADGGKSPLGKTPEQASREMDAVGNLRETMVKMDDYNRNGAPFYMGFGLYSGDKVYQESLLPIYFAVIEQRFKAPTVARVQNELKKFAAAPMITNPNQLTPQEEENLGKNYDLLKAYLMLSGDYKERANAADISNALKDYWVSESKLPSDLNLIAQQQLEFWAKQVDREGTFPRISLDQNLVKATRDKLKAFPPVSRYYKRKVAEISKEIDEKIGPTNVENILVKNNASASYIEGAYTVPGAYTLEGYKQMKIAIHGATLELGVDDWVMGEQGKSAIAQTTDVGKLEEFYLRDYAQHWRNFVKGVSVKPYKKDTAATALQEFSSVSSPMKILVKQIALNTNFSAKPVAGGWFDWITSLWGKKAAVSTGGNTPVEKEFQPLFIFVGDDIKPNAPIEVYQGEIGKVSNRFSGLSVAEINELSVNLAKDDDKKFTELRAANTKIGTLLSTFNATGTGQDVAALLKKPLGNLSSLLGADAQTQLEKSWKEQLLPQAKELEKGFPFEDAANEADINKLTAYLNPVNGTFSKFYDEQLKKNFDGNPGQLKLKESSATKFSDEFVAYLNKVLQLREVLYQKNATPGFEYEFKLLPVADSLIEVTIDGQKITSEGTGAAKFKFPGSGETGVLMSFASTGGTASTSGNTATTANTSAANTATVGNTNSASKFLQSNSNTKPLSGDSSSSTIKRPGTWGLFRFFYEGSPNKSPTGEYALTYTLGGKKVSATITPSGGDLFDKDLFRTMRAPDKFLK
ncbi:MAG: type VI secretion system membrane subunit TssM [Pyrinomonadaceae bacterium]|nr:type VI secretion system membrane subunit TssM [Pyrinomonadaceae bacterium]